VGLREVKCKRSDAMGKEQVLTPSVELAVSRIRHGIPYFAILHTMKSVAVLLIYKLECIS
jgi:hypothetical protein